MFILVYNPVSKKKLLICNKKAIYDIYTALKNIYGIHTQLKGK